MKSYEISRHILKELIPRQIHPNFRHTLNVRYLIIACTSALEEWHTPWFIDDWFIDDCHYYQSGPASVSTLGD